VAKKKKRSLDSGLEKFGAGGVTSHCWTVHVVQQLMCFFGLLKAMKWSTIKILCAVTFLPP